MIYLVKALPCGHMYVYPYQHAFGRMAGFRVCSCKHGPGRSLIRLMERQG